MFTQCPECKTQHTLTADQLRASRGMLKCRQCAAMFDALQSISEQPIAQPTTPQVAELFRERESETGRYRALWLGGLCIGLLALAGQFIYFESYNLSQSPALRPWLMRMCGMVGCRLPNYKNAEEISIVRGSLEATGESSYRFQAIVVNQAGFSQPYPDVRLTLLNFTGEAFAERTFSADEYEHPTMQLAADDSGEIVLDIAAPARKIGGYSFKLL